MNTKSFSIMMMILVIISGGLAITGAVLGHNGLFEIGGESFKVALAGAVGAFASAMTNTG